MQKNKFKTTLSSIADFLFEPHSCLCCRRECDLDKTYRLCSRCLGKITFTGDHFCLHCGERIGDDADFCGNCKTLSNGFDYARNIFVYDDNSKDIILNFKYHGLKSHAKPLGKMLADFYATSDIIASATTFVPMPKSRLKERGYNQAEELARQFSLQTGMPLIDALERIKEVPKQANLSAKERAANIVGSFAVTDKALVKGKDILLIDDVLTTGATANECAKVLKKAGARSVVLLTLAKTMLSKVGFEL